VKGDEALSILLGRHLDTVSFVMDYVEFRIGYSILRAHADPRVELHDGTTAQFPEPGSRDALCRLIDSEVVSAHEAAEGTLVEIRTSRGDLLVIDGSGYPRPEFAHLVPADERGDLVVSQMYIW
jgi:predicted dehydrogenase